MNNYCVYCHLNKINGKKYIGITCQEPNKRWRLDGKGYKGQRKFWNAILKYGWNNFEHIILYDKLSELEAQLIEERLIKEYDTINNGYNAQDGGNVTTHSQITLQKISAAMKGHTHTEETIQLITKIKQENSGKKVMCVETKNVYNSLGEAMRMTGVDKSSIAKVCKGLQHSAGGYHWKFVGKYESENKNSTFDQRLKKVKCITTNKIYNSVTEASKDTGCDPSAICKVCKGIYKTTKKLKWQWIN